jgi:hypothetical protein
MDSPILPLLDGFSPEMILVSYGFDPHWSDPLGNLRLSAGGYGQLIGSLASWADKNCQGRIALFLEGGYNLDAARACSLAVVASLLGKTLPELPGKEFGPSPDPEGTAWPAYVRQARYDGDFSLSPGRSETLILINKMCRWTDYLQHHFTEVIESTYDSH